MSGPNNLSDASTFAVTVGGSGQANVLSALYPVNVQQLRKLPAQPGTSNGFSLSIYGSIAQGAGLQTITFTLFLGINAAGSGSAQMTSGITITIPTTSFVASTTVGYRLQVDWISQGNENPLTSLSGHYDITAWIAGAPIAVVSGGNGMQFQNILDTLGNPLNNQFVWMEGSVGGAGPTINGFGSMFELYEN